MGICNFYTSTTCKIPYSNLKNKTVNKLGISFFSWLDSFPLCLYSNDDLKNQKKRHICLLLYEFKVKKRNKAVDRYYIEKYYRFSYIYKNMIHSLFKT